MNKVNRTAHCTNCGGVLFKIKPSTGYVIYDCVDCNQEDSNEYWEPECISANC